jgi:putative flippase GtrA
MIQSALHSLGHERRTVLLQLIRYALAGLAITLAAAASYWAIAELLHVDPMLSYTIVFIVFSGISYVTHGEFSFKGHGERDRHHIRMGRFFAINVLGFLVNQGFIWLLVKQMDGPTWWPTIPMIFVTPLLTFVLHRRFVYA